LFDNYKCCGSPPTLLYIKGGAAIGGGEFSP
jgi:hypothetical protein